MNNILKVSVKDIPEVVEAMEKASKEIERLNNIIKEVREYIKSMKIWDIEQEEDMKKLLEILDKGE